MLRLHAQEEFCFWLPSGRMKHIWAKCAQKTLRYAIPALSISNLTFDAPSGRRLLDIDALSVKAGETLAITGASGAGKSTLLFAMAGLLPSVSGRILWDDIDLVPQTDALLSRFRGDTFGIVFQDHLLFDELSAVGNASLAALYSPKQQRAAIETNSQRLIGDLGLDSSERRRVQSYSGGERQRIAVARALASNPPVILADEPTASLDRTTADGLIGDLFSMAKEGGRTLIVVSHDPSVISAADTVIKLEDGQIV